MIKLSWKALSFVNINIANDFLSLRVSYIIFKIIIMITYSYFGLKKSLLVQEFRHTRAAAHWAKINLNISREVARCPTVQPYLSFKHCCMSTYLMSLLISKVSCLLKLIYPCHLWPNQKLSPKCIRLTLNILNKLLRDIMRRAKNFKNISYTHCHCHYIYRQHAASHI